MQYFLAHAPETAIIATLIAFLVLSGAANKPLVRWGAGAFQALILVDQLQPTALPHYAICIAGGIGFMVAISLLNEFHKWQPAKRQPDIKQLFDFEEVT